METRLLLSTIVLTGVAGAVALRVRGRVRLSATQGDTACCSEKAQKSASAATSCCTPRATPHGVATAAPSTNGRTVVIGAGPIGMAAAAHLLERGIETIVLERGAHPGSTVKEWAHVQFFSDWGSLLDGASVRRLQAAGWTTPDTAAFPTGGEFVRRYLDPLAATLPPGVLRLHHRVSAISREGLDKVVSRGREDVPFLVRCETPDGPIELGCDNVIDASGTWTSPSPIGASGLTATGEVELTASGRLEYGMPDVLGAKRARYAGARTLVVGAGHSAAGVLLDLVSLRKSAPATAAVWGLRRPTPSRAYGALGKDSLEKRGNIGKGLKVAVEGGDLQLLTSFRLLGLAPKGGGVEVTYRSGGDEPQTMHVDRIVACTGQRPDLSITRELRLDLDPWLEAPRALAPLIDPNEHSCGTVPPHGIDEVRVSSPCSPPLLLPRPCCNTASLLCSLRASLHQICLFLPRLHPD